MKTRLLILMCSSIVLFGCNKNNASQSNQTSADSNLAASETAQIDADRQQLMDELTEYKDNPNLPPVQQKLANAYYEMLKTGAGDLDEIRAFISELQEVEQAAQPTDSTNEQFEIRLTAKPLPDATAHYAATIINRLEVISLNDTSTSITSVKVNRGNCPVGGGENYKNMQYGTVAEIIIRCDASQVREVTLSTAKGEYTFNMNGQ
ncbi:hypothetical protein [Acinetobacter beijerinckii]|uniref:Lipoprotein n=1 Tax=Acinetobacter beijerinckii CIP 110307 TaxID=1217648 RepID=N9FSV5_9GAMM|nr:hypothetical protein [Acinetobacter beijerinckii]ENW08006.1 hypothetical protein F933_00532 [Acinetobacter beijerinckii CIP 110307]